MSCRPGTSGLQAGEDVSETEFATLMAPLGLFEPRPRLAAAVSGGPDSLALALLADAWVRARAGSLLALIVDHGLRPTSGSEAAETAARLSARGIPSRVLVLEGVQRGPALAERARTARYAALVEASRGEGIVHLLLGHHAADQAETVIMRALAGSGPAGLAAMASVVETSGLRLLRPLLSIPPARLRATVAAAGLAWVEDPSNRDQTALRPRLRRLRADRAGAGRATVALVEAAAADGRARARRDAEQAAALAAMVSLRPEGFACIEGNALPPEALAALLQAISGANFPPSPAAVAGLARQLRPATIGGVQIVRARHLFLLAREPAAVQDAVPARPGARWDRRFQLSHTACPPAQSTIGAVGDDAPSLRRHSDLPAVVLRTLPALRQHDRLLAVPHISFPDSAGSAALMLQFSPGRAAAGAPRFCDMTASPPAVTVRGCAIAPDALSCSDRGASADGAGAAAEHGENVSTRT